MGPCSHFWVCAIVCMIAFKPYVYCGSCTDNNDCVGTDSTIANCDATTKQCTCKAGYGPIRTGCGLKLLKPGVYATDGRSNYLFSAATGTLRCTDIPGAISYRWTLPDGTKNNSQTLTITAAGAYSCQAISNTESLNSDDSGTYTVTGIGGSVAAYAGTLVASLNYRDNIFTGNSITFSCYGVPMGYSDAVIFVDGTNTVLATSAASSVSAQLVMAADKTGLSIACSLPTTSQVTFTKSANLNLPTPISPNPITAVAVTAVDSFGPVSSGASYKVGTFGPMLTCTTTPVPAYLDTTKQVEYDFQADGVSKQKSTSNTYQVNITAESSVPYSCVATHNGVTVQTASFFIISGSTNFLTAPFLRMVKPATAITIGSTLVLSCGVSKDSALAYTWLVNDKVIDAQFDWTIQLYNFTEADIGVYRCRTRKSRYTADSTFHAITQSTVTRVTPGTLYVKGGDYVLKCNTGSSVTNGWTYSWKKDKIDLNITTDSYSIKNASATIHDGSYTCTSTYNEASNTSDILNVAVVDAGLRCTSANEATICISPRYSGTCPTATPQICDCANYFVPSGEACDLIKPTISRSPAGTVFYAGSNYVLTCNAASNDTSGWTFAWKNDNNALTGSTSTYTITGANAATHNGSYTCTTTYSTVSSTSDALIVSVVASRTAPFISCALMVVMAALGSLFI